MRANYKVMFTKLSHISPKDGNPYDILLGVFEDTGKSKAFYLNPEQVAAYKNLIAWKFYNFEIDVSFAEGNKTYVNLIGISDIPLVK